MATALRRGEGGSVCTSEIKILFSASIASCFKLGWHILRDILRKNSHLFYKCLSHKTCINVTLKHFKHHYFSIDCCRWKYWTIADGHQFQENLLNYHPNHFTVAFLDIIFIIIRWKRHKGWGQNICCVLKILCCVLKILIACFEEDLNILHDFDLSLKFS